MLGVAIPGPVAFSALKIVPEPVTWGREQVETVELLATLANEATPVVLVELVDSYLTNVSEVLSAPGFGTNSGRR